MECNPTNEVQTILAQAAASMRQQIAGEEIGGVPFVMVPDGYNIRTIERFLPTPKRTRATVTVRSTEAFIAYFKEFATDGSKIFSSDSAPHKITGVIDYPTKGAPEWGDHRVVCECVPSPEYSIWSGRNGARMGQAEFAEFIENNLPDFISPDGATILEVANSLEMKKTVQFQSGQRLQDGMVQFMFIEDAKATAGKGKLEIPSEFKIEIPIFRNGESYKMVAKLRYRVKDGALSFWFEIPRLTNLVDSAFAAMVKGVADSLGRAVISGDAPKLDTAHARNLTT